MQKVYLAGGMRVNWRESVKAACDEFVFLDPTQSGTAVQWREYGPWDIHAVRQCDIVFGVMEQGNPSGIGLAAEVGLAYGLGRTVILVLEPGNEWAKYMDFLRAFTVSVFDSVEAATQYLKTFQGM
jgi:nucleoside 2-deoxyribosyltransferase